MSRPTTVISAMPPLLMSDTLHAVETARWHQSELRRSLQDRLATLEVAERLLARREQHQSTREVVFQQALATATSGPTKDLESSVIRLVDAALSRQPPMESTVAFVKELEDRATQLEVALHHVYHKLLDVGRRESALAAKEAALAAHEKELSSAREASYQTWQALERRERSVGEREAGLLEMESELQQWANRLNEHEMLFVDDNRRAATLPECRNTTGGGALTKERDLAPMRAEEDASQDMKHLQRQLVEVAAYLGQQFETLIAGKQWLEERAAAVEEATARLHSLHVTINPAMVNTLEHMPLPVIRDDVHPLLQTLGGRWNTTQSNETNTVHLDTTTE